MPYFFMFSSADNPVAVMTSGVAVSSAVGGIGAGVGVAAGFPQVASSKASAKIARMRILFIVLSPVLVMPSNM